jgi:phosphatidylserine/phosphatidylglycerophosphate/cardiolipin synthase-like enzyme
MNTAVALANNDVVFLSWIYDTRIPDCMGFTIRRTNLQNRTITTLPAWVGFKGQSNANWNARTTDEWPVQKFTWRDLTAESETLYQYEIIPMLGEPGNLNPSRINALITNPVRTTARCGSISAFFNRGILSTQSLAHTLPKGPNGAPDYRKLIDRIDQPGDPLRNRLAGQLTGALTTLLKRAQQESGQCYAALYELNDPELMQALLGMPSVHLILSNTGKTDDVNHGNRQALRESGTDITDRMLKGDHLGHNKFMVYVDRAGRPQSVLTGSTNWTYTGLCGQNNNALLIEDPTIAGFYLDYWQRLLADNAEQGSTLRTQNNEARQNLATGTTVWFSPNTGHKTKGTVRPGDLSEVFNVIEQAQQAVLFLVFQPGEPSIVGATADAQKKNSDLIVYGAATDPKAVEQYDTELYHRTATKPGTIKHGDSMVAVAGIDDEFAFWRQELLKTSPQAHAVIHDKIVVVDPLSDNCTVVTGSHNLGYKASYQNDENLLIIRGNRALAEAYATHVMDVYGHYRWRYTVQNEGISAWSGLETKDTWQDKYFKPGHARKELELWTSVGRARGAKAA